MNKRLKFLAATLATGSVMLAASPAMAEVTIGVNFGLPQAYIAPAPVYYQPQPVYVAPRHVYVQPQSVYYGSNYVTPQPVYHYSRPYTGHPRDGMRRDRDRDGVPDRVDRDRDGDGVPNRYDRAPNNPRYR